MKYYVFSGGYKEVLTAKDPVQAAKIFLDRVEQKEDAPLFGLLTQVSELGFVEPNEQAGLEHENDILLSTRAVMDGELDNIDWSQLQ